MEKSRKKRILIFSLLVIVCGAILTVILNRPKAYCSMYVTTDYSGWGEDGHFLGSGSFEQEFQVKAGDCFYEEHNGVWDQNPKHNMFYERIVEILEVREDGVTVLVYSNGTVSLPYEKKRDVDSTFTIYDGINYYHEMHFFDYVVR